MTNKNDSGFQNIYNFLRSVNKLKTIERYKGKYYWDKYTQPSRYESVADHTWRVCLMLYLFKHKMTNKFNFEKAIKMALIHDLAEIITGDLSPLGNDGTGKNSFAFNKTKKLKKYNYELKAMKKILSSLDNQLLKEINRVWLEYEAENSLESKIVKAMDKLEAMMQILEYTDGNLLKEHLDFTLAYGLEKTKTNHEISEFAAFVAKKLYKLYIKAHR